MRGEEQEDGVPWTSRMVQPAAQRHGNEASYARGCVADTENGPAS